MIRINLLPVKAARKKEKLRAQLLVLFAAVIVLLVGCAALYASMLASISGVREEIARNEEEVSRLKKKIGEVAQYQKRQEELKGKLEVLEKLKTGRKGPVRLLDDLSRAAPEKLWLTSFKENGGNVTAGGIGMNEETVAEFLRNLEASPLYQKVELRVIEQINQGGQKLHRFELTCQTETPAGK
jgi:type IV pilus assembly protein PilN